MGDAQSSEAGPRGGGGAAHAEWRVVEPTPREERDARRRRIAARRARPAVERPEKEAERLPEPPEREAEAVEEEAEEEERGQKGQQEPRKEQQEGPFVFVARAAATKASPVHEAAALVEGLPSPFVLARGGRMCSALREATRAGSAREAASLEAMRDTLAEHFDSLHGHVAGNQTRALSKMNELEAVAGMVVPLAENRKADLRLFSAELARLPRLHDDLKAACVNIQRLTVALESLRHMLPEEHRPPRFS